MTTVNTTLQLSDVVVNDLVGLLDTEPGLALALEESLLAAKQSGASSLDSELYEALDWPTSIDDYLSFLRGFARWAPDQSPLPAWQDSGNGSQEVFDRLCHFYFLIDQPAADGSVVQNNASMAIWLVAYADAWGTYLNTPESFNQQILDNFRTFSPEYRIQDSMIDDKPNGDWDCFNAFFARELNPGLRPIADQGDNRTVVCPADCTYKQVFAINDDSTIDEITLKGTHKVASVADLLQDSPYADAFAGGTFVHYFLGPYSYHRFHAPVSGEIVESRAVRGQTYLAVEIDGDQFSAPDSAKDGYEFTQARGILTIDTTQSADGNVGIVTTIPVGMAQVSSVHMTATPGSTNKGDEFGYFLFGGSDIIVLFQAGVDPVIDLNTNYRHYGTPIATCQPLEG